MAVLATTPRQRASAEQEDSEASEASQQKKRATTTRKEHSPSKTASRHSSPESPQARRSRSCSPQRDMYCLMMQLLQKLDNKIEDLRRKVDGARQTTDSDSRLTSGLEGTSSSSPYNTPNESPEPLGTHTRSVCFAAAQPVLPAQNEAMLNWDPLLRGRYAYLTDFKGEDGRQWINLMEGHFKHTKMAEEHKYDVALRYFAANVMCDWEARGDTYARTWEGIKQFIADWYDPVTLSSVRERLAKVKWEGSVQKLQNDILRAVGMCTDFTEEQLITNFVGRLPKRLQHKYGTEVAQMKAFQEVVAYFRLQDHWDKELARANIEVNTQANYANYLREERDGERQRKVKLDQQSGKKPQRVVTMGRTHGTGTAMEGDTNKTDDQRPITRLGPCRYCKGRGHYSQACTNLKGSNAPKETVCYECRGTGHFGRECANKLKTDTQGQGPGYAKTATNIKVAESTPQGNEQA